MRRIAVPSVVFWLLACSGMAELTDENLVVDPDVEEEVEEEEEEEAPEPDGPALPELDLDGERDPDCTMADPSEFDPLLSESQAHGDKPVLERHPNGIVETVRMQNGMVVRVVRTGCEHAGETWHVSPAPKGKKGLAEAASKVLGKVTTEGEPSVLACVKAAPDDVPEEGFEAGEAVWCNLRVVDGVLEMSHDFAL